MIADIEGSISGVDKNQNITFEALINIKNGKESNIIFFIVKLDVVIREKQI